MEMIRNNRIGNKDIKDLTTVRGQDGKISNTQIGQGKDFWSPTRLRRVGDQ